MTFNNVSRCNKLFNDHNYTTYLLFLLVLELLRQFSSRLQYTAAVTVPVGSGVSHLHFLTLTAKNEYT